MNYGWEGAPVKEGRSKGSKFVVDGIEVIFDQAEALSRLKDDTVVGLDIETSGLSPIRDKIASIQMYGDESGALCFLHLRGRPLNKRLCQFLSKQSVLWLTHNGITFDIQFLLNNGVDVFNTHYYDSLLAETVITPNVRSNVRFSLKETLRRRLGVTLDKDVDHGSWMLETVPDAAIAYAARDVSHMPALRRAQHEKARQFQQHGALGFEHQVLPSTVAMVSNGMPIDLELLAEYLDAQRTVVNDIERNFGLLMGSINWNSPMQVKAALAKNGIKVKSTNALTLKDTEIALMLEGSKKRLSILQALMKHRGAAQRLKMYSEKWINKHVIDGFVHPGYWQCGTDTGRYSSSKPNIQQVPRDMRWVFRAPDGIKVITADYSGIEALVAGVLAKDRTMLAAFETEDFHATVATLIFNVGTADITSNMRQIAKAATFTLLFGGSAGALYATARRGGSDITMEDATNVYRNFYRRFSDIARMRSMAYQLAGSRKQIWLTLPSGLRRLLVGSKARPAVVLNTSVQGTAGVGLKRALIECKKRGLLGYLAATVHDEIVAMAPEAEAAEVAAELKEAMVVGMQETIDYTPRVGVSIEDAWTK